ncbi:DUF1750-domain-containing protein [Choiromyces venosus 120613-1]|uniref:DUF1750-domain-containing protein n=1 Tax=Choiromyces venosus 120613-1 TaxID=1336337 RepID=A0A3N4JP07_9PEZI|nr:DUF1750-domain-containing protein [Choiromyces venosus 120613-1]
MADPSSSVSPQLLHHLHALCIMKYPQHQTIQPELLVELLLKTSQVAQQHPFTWMMIDPPQPGTLMLSWNPPQMVGVCASDGYVWADAEIAHTVEVKGYQIEIHYHKAGYNPNAPNQSHAVHSRRRYRLKPGHPSTPPENANLWFLHYIQAERQNPVSINTVPLTSSIRQSFTARNYISQLFQTGQLPRKEFYLPDRNSWPLITLPNQQQQQQQQQHPQQQQQQQIQMQAQQQATMQIQTPQHNRQISPMNARATPQPPQSAQQVYYTPARANAKAPGGAPPSAKRLKPTPPGGHNPAAAAAQAAALGADPSMTIDEEEDTSRGDMLDHLSPREIATTRYIQHHEWMEEIMGSPYAIDKIEPVDLGLGLRGELEIVTKGLLDPPAYPPIPKPQRTGDATKDKEKSQAEILEELRPRVESKIREMEAEMLRMQDAHAKRLQKIKQSGVTKDAELKLRIGLGLTPQNQPEAETHQVHTPGNEMEDCRPEPTTTATAIKDLSAVEEIVRDVEHALGKKVVEKKMLARHDLPVEEIVKMGGVVAEGDGLPNPDIIMAEGQDDNNNGNQQDDNEGGGNLNGTSTIDDEFNLTLGNMPDENGTDSSRQSEMGFPQTLDDPSDIASPLPPPATTAGGAASGTQEEDTIMDDFMNVDQDSKPDTPNVEEKKEKDPENTSTTSTTAPAAPTTATTATTSPPVTDQQQQQKPAEDVAPSPPAGSAGFMFSPPTEKVDESTSTSTTTSAGGPSGAGGIPGLGMALPDGN